MSCFIKEFGIINENVTDQIINHISKDPQPFDKSQLYNSELDEKFIDEDKRLSQFKTISEIKLFRLFDQLLSSINFKDPTNNYFLVRNNITYIKYEKGGFFKEHEDYLSFTSNMLEEYTLLMCADAQGEGGETVFNLNPFFKYSSKQSITPKNTLIFRKDIKHSGSLIKSGYKNIITANLLCSPKSLSRVVLITFPESKTNNTLDLSSSYVLSFDKIKDLPDNLLANILYFSEDQKFIQYTEKKIPFKNFAVINKIFNKSYITLEEYKNNKNYIDYYNIPVENIMIDFGVKREPTSKSKFTTNNNIIISETPEKTLYIQNTIKELRLPYMQFKLILAEGSLSYGGGMEGTPPSLLEMTPVWLSLSENNNIIFYNTLITKSFQSFESFVKLEERKDSEEYSGDNNQGLWFANSFKHKSGKNWVDFFNSLSYKSKVLLLNEEYDEFLDYQESNSESDGESKSETKTSQAKVSKNNLDRENCQPFPEQLECKNIEFEDTSGAIKIPLNVDFFYNHTADGKPKYFQGGLFLDKTDNNQIFEVILREYQCDYYPIFRIGRKPPIKKSHGSITIDEDGKSVLDPKNTSKIMKKLEDIKFIQNVKDNINNLNIVLPQRKSNFSENFCNEDVYGNLNLIMVEGFVKLN